MEYKKYQHVEKLGREECDGVLDGKVYCFAKIDGSNGCIFLDDNGDVCAGSRRRALTLDDDNGGFYQYVLEHPEFRAYLEKHPNHILYGEWMIPHTIRTYSEDVWKNFYVFDVFEYNNNQSSRYIPYDKYKEELDQFGIVYIPVLAILDHPSIDDIASLAKDNHYLIPDQNHIGEGIVCKQYGYRNKWGRTVWGKFVADEFFNKKQKLRSKNHDMKSDFELKIANEYITDAVIRKEYAKICIAYPNSKQNERIGRILNAVYDTFINEDLLDVVRKNKSCTINFRYMKKQSDNRVKEVLRHELF